MNELLLDSPANIFSISQPFKDQWLICTKEHLYTLTETFQLKKHRTYLRPRNIHLACCTFEVTQEEAWIWAVACTRKLSNEERYEEQKSYITKGIKQPRDLNEPYRIQFFRDSHPLENLFIGLPQTPFKIEVVKIQSFYYLLIGSTNELNCYKLLINTKDPSLSKAELVTKSMFGEIPKFKGNVISIHVQESVITVASMLGSIKVFTFSQEKVQQQ